MFKNITRFSYLLMVIVIFILPFFSVEGYLFMKNTTSQLGAQSTPNAWIMKTEDNSFYSCFYCNFYK